MRQIDSYSVNILERTKRFSILIIRLSSYLPKNPAGYTIANQIVRSATSIGANLIEAQEAVSKAEFLHKITISLKEAKETAYWLELIQRSELLNSEMIHPAMQECDEVVKILVATVKKLRLKK